jgi:16S rRNA (guanine(966)-N(2))-methyltransferase RsmD
MTRIVAGVYGGRRIGTPPGQDTRPTSERVREALFGALGDRTGTRFADLYAGSGAIGLEAASRGAVHVLLVESDPSAVRVIRENIALLKADTVARLAPSRVERILAAGPLGEPYDVVVADPPYPTGEAEITEMLGLLVEHAWLAPEASVIVERSRRSPEPEWVPGITAERSRRYGDTVLWYGRPS